MHISKKNIQIEENSSPYLETNCTYLKGNFHTSPITRVVHNTDFSDTNTLLLR